MKAEHDRILKEMKPIAASIQNSIGATLENAKNVSVTVYDKDSFDASFDLDVASKSEEAAKWAGAEAIQAVQESNSDYQFSLISAVITCKGAPVGIVNFEPSSNKYTFISKGKRSEFTP